MWFKYKESVPETQGEISLRRRYPQTPKSLAFSHRTSQAMEQQK